MTSHHCLDNTEMMMCIIKKVKTPSSPLHTILRSSRLSSNLQFCLNGSETLKMFGARASLSFPQPPSAFLIPPDARPVTHSMCMMSSTLSSGSIGSSHACTCTYNASCADRGPLEHSSNNVSRLCISLPCIIK